MTTDRYSAEEIVRRGESLYEQHIRQEVEPNYKGSFLALNIETGEYEVGPDELEVAERAAAKYPGVPLFFLRIGAPDALRIGAGLRGILE